LEHIRLITFDPDRHATLMVRWLPLPHVVRWWGPHTAAEFLSLESGSVYRIIVWNDRPVGFLQWHRLTREELDTAGLNHFSEGGVDFDIFLGEPEDLGKGIGPEAIRQAMTEVCLQKPPPYFSLCTAASNVRAERAFAKVGFTMKTLFDEGRGPHHFMVRPVAQTPGGDQ
jgi:aminoglycoside 6'-N-acetyltransferase